MKFSLSREAILKPLQLVVGVVERRQTLPILSNVLLSLDGQRLSMTGTDLEVEIVGVTDTSEPGEDGDVTVSARKLLIYAVHCRMAQSLIFPVAMVRR
jgi:DNA polymerase-3 subunit beta